MAWAGLVTLAISGNGDHRQSDAKHALDGSGHQEGGDDGGATTHQSAGLREVGSKNVIGCQDGRVLRPELRQEMFAAFYHRSQTAVAQKDWPNRTVTADMWLCYELAVTSGISGFGGGKRC